MENDLIVAALQSAPVFVTLCDTDKTILWCSSYSYGYSSRDVIGQQFDFNVHPEDRERLNQAADRVLGERVVIMGTIRILTGESPHVIMAFRMSAWSGKGLVIVSWDTLSEAERKEMKKLTPTQKLILARLGYRPLSPKHLSRLVERQYNSHFRTCLSQLCDLGLVVRTSRGYALPPSVWSLPLA